MAEPKPDKPVRPNTILESGDEDYRLSPVSRDVLNAEFTQAARLGDARWGEILLEQGAEPNAVDPVSRLAAVHFVAGGDAQAFFELLAARDDVDFLVRDPQGRLPSVIAFECDFYELGEVLVEKEIDQAEKSGLVYHDFLQGSA